MFKYKTWSTRFILKNIHDNRKALEDFKNKNIVAFKNLWQIPVAREGCQVRTAFSPLQTLISTDLSWSPLCLFCVSGIHRERNQGSSRSTRPIVVHERTAICKSQLLEPIIENHGNMQGAEQAFGRWFADRLYRGLVCLQCRLGTIQNHDYLVIFN